MEKLGGNAERHGYQSESALIIANELSHEYQSGTLANARSSKYKLKYKNQSKT